MSGGEKGKRTWKRDPQHRAGRVQSAEVRKSLEPVKNSQALGSGKRVMWEANGKLVYSPSSKFQPWEFKFDTTKLSSPTICNQQAIKCLQLKKTAVGWDNINHNRSWLISVKHFRCIFSNFHNIPEGRCSNPLFTAIESETWGSCPPFHSPGRTSTFPRTWTAGISAGWRDCCTVNI